MNVILTLARSRESFQGEGLDADGWGREGEILTLRLFWSNARHTHLAWGGFGTRSIVKIINRKAQKHILRHNKARDSTEHEITWSRGGVSRLLASIAYSLMQPVLYSKWWYLCVSGYIHRCMSCVDGTSRDSSLQ